MPALALFRLALLLLGAFALPGVAYCTLAGDPLLGGPLIASLMPVLFGLIAVVFSPRAAVTLFALGVGLTLLVLMFMVNAAITDPDASPFS
jgi:hypothetical protein